MEEDSSTEGIPLPIKNAMQYYDNELKIISIK